MLAWPLPVATILVLQVAALAADAAVADLLTLPGVAYFNRDTCKDCARQSACPVKLRKNSAVLRVELNTVFTAEAREQVKDKDAMKEANG